MSAIQFHINYLQVYVIFEMDLKRKRRIIGRQEIRYAQAPQADTALARVRMSKYAYMPVFAIFLSIILNQFSFIFKTLSFPNNTFLSLILFFFLSSCRFRNLSYLMMILFIPYILPVG